MAKLLQDILDKLKKVQDSIETIELGVYGDSKNEVKGLIQNVRDLQESVKKLQDERKKIIYISIGAISIIEIIWGILKWANIV